jgi:hypothetical protein
MTPSPPKHTPLHEFVEGLAFVGGGSECGGSQSDGSSFFGHKGMDLRDELVRLACDNRASAQPLFRFGIFPVLGTQEIMEEDRPRLGALRSILAKKQSFV